MEEIKLTDEEKTITKHYQDIITQKKMSLANLRQQYLLAENNIIQQVAKAEEDYKSYLKSLADGKKLSAEDNWVFDASKLVFKK